MQIDALLNQYGKHQIDYYLVPSTDEYLGEYSPKSLQRLKHISGFDGSNGLAVIGKDQKFLLTDSRYLLQARKQLPDDFAIIDMADKTTIKKFIESLNGNVCGYDPFVLSLNQLKPFNAAGCNLKAITENLIDNIWQRELQLGSSPYSFPEDIAGENTDSKIKRLLEHMDPKADYLFVTEPEAICWLLNVRGNDLEHSPLVLSHMFVSKAGDIHIISPHASFCNYNYTKAKKTMEVPFFKKIEKKLIQCDFSKVPQGFLNVFEGYVQNATCPINTMKMIKNDIEIAGFVKAHNRDGKILRFFLDWLEKKYKNDLTEYEIAEKLNFFRGGDPDFLCPSFPPIVGYGKNGAIVHYKPNETESLKVGDDELLLIDSGGHYKFGTTDVTRTVHLGIPSEEQIKMFTLVLKGQIALSMHEFKEGTTGDELDAIARKPLQDNGVDYGHGTGHGVGHVLSVHEGPCKISKAKGMPLQAGMILSIEPGYYKEGEYGIRHENLVVVVKSETDGYLKFNTLTHVPVQMKLVDESLLSEAEREFLHDYNKRCEA